MKPPIRTANIQNCDRSLDLLAARQMFPAHWHHQDNATTAPSNFFSDEPIPVDAIPTGFPHWIGKTRGNVTVIGFFGVVQGKRPRAYWVTRCTCGGFELIRHETLAKPEKGTHMCARCRTAYHHRELRRPDFIHKKPVQKPQ